MKKIAPRSAWLPDYVAPTVRDIDVDALLARGITHLALDLDETLVPHGGNTLTTEDMVFLAHARQLGLKLFIASNTLRNIDVISQAIPAHAVRATLVSRKPFRVYYRRLITAAAVPPQHIAMAGDNVLNDVYGANRAGLVTIFVPARTRWRRALYRRYSKWVLRQRHF